MKSLKNKLYLLLSITLLASCNLFSNDDDNNSKKVEPEVVLPWCEQDPLHCGTFTDERDNQTYEWTSIVGKIWMAENLNYASENSHCYDNSQSNCDRLGRLYDWVETMQIDTIYKTDFWEGESEEHQGVCSKGWHVPSKDEFQELFDFTDSADGSNYRQTRVLLDSVYFPDYGMDKYGFKVVYSGFSNLNDENKRTYNYIGRGVYFQSRTNVMIGDSSETSTLDFTGIKDNELRDVSKYIGVGWKAHGYSLRCIANKNTQQFLLENKAL
jgi:uncharacterized protein (TIGR02145 family)